MRGTRPSRPPCYNSCEEFGLARDRGTAGLKVSSWLGASLQNRPHAYKERERQGRVPRILASLNNNPTLMQIHQPGFTACTDPIT